jgi:hypothetical protein
MPTQKQIAANRRNAQHSTGPRTPAGKAATRFNALKHGIHAKEQIMFGETEEDLLHLAVEYHEQYAPANPTERLLVDTLINNEWRLRRLRCTEAELWQSESEIVIQRKLDERDQQEDAYEPEETDEPERPRVPVVVTAGETFAQGLKSFTIVQRVINSCERNLHRALKELQRLKSESRLAEIAPQPQTTETTSAPVAPFYQFPNPAPLPDTNPSPAPVPAPDHPAPPSPIR